MLLITSGSYLEAEFTSELGLLPPAFLPVGNKRLFALQVESLAAFAEPIYLSLPDTFRLQEMDALSLERLGVSVLPVPEGLSLGQSILHAVALAAPTSASLRILHGDTLIRSLPQELDVYSVGQTSAYYRWAEERPAPGGKTVIAEGLPGGGAPRPVLSGFFAFADRQGFMRHLAASSGRFIPALNAYADRQGLRSARTGRWFDFGHVHTYCQSKAVVTTQRAFNTMEISTATVVKTSADAAKMRAEAQWYKGLPANMRLYAPRFLGFMEGPPAGYAVEYLYLSTLAELFVFGELPPFVWERIFAALDRFLADCGAHSAPPDAHRAAGELYLPKTLERLETLARRQHIDINKPWTINGQSVPGLADMARQAASAIPAPQSERMALVHGDLCFSNILYDFRRQAVQVIDPRGMDARKNQTPYGDPRYDLAKLYHSVMGGYDCIKADAFTLKAHTAHDLELALPSTTTQRAAQYAFLNRTYAGMNVASDCSLPICVLLFLSMLPLHADNPKQQMALLANALRLFTRMDASAAARPLAALQAA